MMQALRSSGPEGWERLITGVQGYNKAVVSLEPSPMLLGVGYIIGPRIASVMVGGGILAALVLVPDDRLLRRPACPPSFPGAELISAMAPEEIRASTSSTSAPGRWPPAAS